jgi:hypothetical protein
LSQQRELTSTNFQDVPGGKRKCELRSGKHITLHETRHYILLCVTLQGWCMHGSCSLLLHSTTKTGYGHHCHSSRFKYSIFGQQRSEVLKIRMDEQVFRRMHGARYPTLMPSPARYGADYNILQQYWKFSAYQTPHVTHVAGPICQPLSESPTCSE